MTPSPNLQVFANVQVFDINLYVFGFLVLTGLQARNENIHGNCNQSTCKSVYRVIFVRHRETVRLRESHGKTVKP